MSEFVFRRRLQRSVGPSSVRGGCQIIDLTAIWKSIRRKTNALPAFRRQLEDEAHSFAEVKWGREQHIKAALWDFSSLRDNDNFRQRLNGISFNFLTHSPCILSFSIWKLAMLGSCRISAGSARQTCSDCSVTCVWGCDCDCGICPEESSTWFTLLLPQRRCSSMLQRPRDGLPGRSWRKVSRKPIFTADQIEWGWDWSQVCNCVSHSTWMAALEASTCLRRTTRVATENRNRNSRKNLCGFSLRRVQHRVTSPIPTIAAIQFQYWMMSQVVVNLTVLFPLPGMLRVGSAAAHCLPRTFLLHGNLFSLFCSPHSSTPLGLVNKFMPTRCNIDGAYMSTLTLSFPPRLHDLFSCTRKCAYAMCAHTHNEKGHVRKVGESCTHLSSFWVKSAEPEQAHVLTLGITTKVSYSL